MQKLAKIMLITLLTSATSVAAAAPVGYSINADGVDDATHDSLYRIDLATGSETRIGRVNSLGLIRNDVEGLAFAPDGTLYGVDDEVMKLFPLNPDNGAIVASEEVNISGLPFGGQNDFGMTFACDGTLYVTSVTRGSLYQMGLDGKADRIGVEGALGANISAIAAFGENPVMIYGLGNGLKADLSEDTPSLFRIDVLTGEATEIGPLGGSAGSYAEGGLSFDDDGQLWAITDRRNSAGAPLPSQVMKIDRTTGAASDVRDTGEAGFESLAITVPRGCATSGGDNALFKVQKQFVDGTKDLPTTLNIRCTSGQPLEQSYTTEPGEGVEVTFTVTDFEDGQLNCEVFESTLDDYSATYECFTTGDCTATENSCSFTGASAGQENLCVIRNYPRTTQVEVSSEWVHDTDEVLGEDAVRIELTCRNIVGGDGHWGSDGMYWSWIFHPETPSQFATVQPGLEGFEDPSECRTVTIPMNSATESDSTCEDWTPLFADYSTLSCTVTHTIFFEGIPTLNRGGLLLTVLLMLFTGLVFVRRF